MTAVDPWPLGLGLPNPYEVVPKVSNQVKPSSYLPTSLTGALKRPRFHAASF
jgi:hypothetical protein